MVSPLNRNHFSSYDNLSSDAKSDQSVASSQQENNTQNEEIIPSYGRRVLTIELAEHLQPTVGFMVNEDPTSEEEQADVRYWALPDAIYRYYRGYVDHHASFGPDPSLHAYQRDVLWPETVGHVSEEASSSNQSQPQPKPDYHLDEEVEIPLVNEKPSENQVLPYQRDMHDPS